MLSNSSGNLLAPNERKRVRTAARGSGLEKALVGSRLLKTYGTMPNSA